ADERRASRLHPTWRRRRALPRRHRGYSVSCARPGPIECPCRRWGRPAWRGGEGRYLPGRYEIVNGAKQLGGQSLAIRIAGKVADGLWPVGEAFDHGVGGLGVEFERTAEGTTFVAHLRSRLEEADRKCRHLLLDLRRREATVALHEDVAPEPLVDQEVLDQLAALARLLFRQHCERLLAHKELRMVINRCG